MTYVQQLFNVVADNVSFLFKLYYSSAGFGHRGLSNFIPRNTTGRVKCVCNNDSTEVQTLGSVYMPRSLTMSVSRSKMG